MVDDSVCESPDTRRKSEVNITIRRYSLCGQDLVFVFVTPCPRIECGSVEISIIISRLLHEPHQLVITAEAVA